MQTPVELDVEDLDTRLKVELIVSHFGVIASLLIIGGMHTAEIMFGAAFGWWLIPLSIVPLAMVLWAANLNFKARYILGWEEDDDTA